MLPCCLQYEAMYRWSVEDPQSFWGSIAAQLHWERTWDKTRPICDYNFNLDKGPISVKVGGRESHRRFLPCCSRTT